MAVPVSKTYAEWAVSTFVLAVGQIGYDSTNDRARIGNGLAATDNYDLFNQFIALL